MAKRIDSKAFIAGLTDRIPAELQAQWEAATGAHAAATAAQAAEAKAWGGTIGAFSAARQTHKKAAAAHAKTVRAALERVLALGNRALRDAVIEAAATETGDANAE